MEALLEQVPDRVETARLILRCTHAGDASAVNAAVCESLPELQRTMPWAQTAPTLERSEAECRRMQARFLLREDLPMLIFERVADGSEGALIGGTGLHRLDWATRCFEIGYWCRTSRVGQGFIGEAVQALAAMAFDRLNARRVEIRMDDRNTRSRRVAERAGFTLEGILRSQSLDPQGAPRDTRVYAKLAASADVATASDDC
jgi:RimJ/RimL family protein N-acetyltransferase